MDNTNSNQYFSIPAHIWNNSNLNRRQKMLFGILNGFLNKQISVTYSNQKLADANECHISKVKSDLKILEDEQLIVRHGYSYRRKIYRGDLFFNTHAKISIDIGQDLNTGTQTSILTDQELNTRTHMGPILDPYGSHTGPKRVPYQTHMGPQYIYINNNKDNNNNKGPAQESTTCSEPVVVISLLIDKDLLRFKSSLPTTNQPSCSDFEFLEWAYWKINSDINIEKIDQPHAINRLKKLMRAQRFEKPDGFVSESEKIKTAKKVEDRLKLQEEQSKRKADELIKDWSNRPKKSIDLVSTKKIGNLLPKLI